MSHKHVITVLLSSQLLIVFITLSIARVKKQSMSVRLSTKDSRFCLVASCILNRSYFVTIEW